MQPSAKSLPSRKAVISTVASVAATVMVAQSLTREFIPRELRTYLFTKFSQFLSTLTNEITLIIDEYDDLTRNQLFYAAEVYLGTINSPSITTFRASLPEKEEKINVSVAKYEEIIDRFCGLRLKWMMGSQKNQAVHHFADSDGSRPSIRSDLRLFKLTFNKNHKSKVVDEYLPYILERSRAVKEEKKTLKLHTLKGDKMHGIRGGGPMWQAVNLDHPASFDTLAMDDEIKKMIVDDLDRFVKRKEFYRKLGKAWKRGYLLFGPPGTGKSSMIAAMSNYLNFDIYDLELTDIRCNSDLRRLLISTTNRSILVVEDIDASIDLSQRKATAPAKPPRGSPPYQYDQEPKVTLSGILNFIDGLWSSCGDERIIIFTTNHKDKLDPALLRPGRMDVHIHMSYCTPCGFKMLLNSYLGMTEHTLMLEAEGLIASTKVTPAEVGEQLLKTDNPELALQGLINFLEHKKECERVAEENLEVNKMEVGVEEKEEEEEEEEEEERGEKLSVVKGQDKLKDLIKRSRASSTEMREKTVKMEEVATALKILFKFLESKNGTEGKSDADTTSSGETVPEAGKSDATKDE